MYAPICKTAGMRIIFAETIGPPAEKRQNDFYGNNETNPNSETADLPPRKREGCSHAPAGMHATAATPFVRHAARALPAAPEPRYTRTFPKGRTNAGGEADAHCRRKRGSGGRKQAPGAEPARR